MLNIIIPIAAAVFAAVMIIAWALYCMQGKSRKRKQSPLMGILCIVFGFFVIALAILSKMGILGNVDAPASPEPTMAADTFPQGSQNPADVNRGVLAGTGTGQQEPGGTVDVPQGEQAPNGITYGANDGGATDDAVPNNIGGETGAEADGAAGTGNADAGRQGTVTN